MKLIAIIFGLALFCAATPSWAQDTPTEPSPEQLRLNNKGVNALAAGHFTEAVIFFEESLTLGAYNVTYLNLGRAYQKMGQCRRARGVLKQVDGAPPVAGTSAELVESRARQFLEELARECPEASQSATTPADSAQTDSVQKHAAGGQAGDAAQPTPPSPPTTSGTSSIWGWSATVGGLALIGGGVGVYFLAESDRDKIREARRDEGIITSMTQADAHQLQDGAETLDIISASMIAAGVITTGVGVYLLMSAPETDTQQPSVSLELSREHLGVSWAGHF